VIVDPLHSEITYNPFNGWTIARGGIVSEWVSPIPPAIPDDSCFFCIERGKACPNRSPEPWPVTKTQQVQPYPSGVTGITLIWMVARLQRLADALADCKKGTPLGTAWELLSVAKREVKHLAPSADGSVPVASVLTVHDELLEGASIMFECPAEAHRAAAEKVYEAAKAMREVRLV
jgi:hypothetical protein